VEPTKSVRLDQVAERARLRCRVGWWGACGWVGHASPSGQILHPDVVGGGSRHEGRLSDRLKPPESVSAQSVLAVTRSDLLTFCDKRR
jgi:hypothetical protein